MAVAVAAVVPLALAPLGKEAKADGFPQLSEWERVYLPIDPGVVLLDIAFVPDDPTHMVHMCNKLASRHVRVGLAQHNKVPCCDICENASAFFYCEVHGTSLCLQCDMIVHVGGK